jgi:hypothetical protein
MDPKPTAASSDGEMLAVGVSTMGSQTKRFSCAQRRKFTVARKIRKGTWTVKKPPRKTNLSQD